MRFFLVGALTAVSVLAASGGSGAVTFHKDVEPLLQKNCQGCHRPGEAAPMSFLTYNETRPWAKAMKEAVRLNRMPPWFADPHVGKFANDRSLTTADRETIVRWADAGAPEGDSADAPSKVVFTEGWNIGTPDMVVEMPQEIEIPAKGTIDYTYVVFPSGLTADKWVRMSEVRPGNRKVLHHVIAFVREPGSKWLVKAKPGVPYVPERDSDDARNGFGGEWLVGYAPGTVPDTLEEGQARLVRAGSDIVLQLHYTASGKAEKDRSKVGFVFSKEPPKQRVTMLAAANGRFAIPPGAANHKVESSFTLGEDVEMLRLLPHMHLRGKAFSYRLTFPDGRTEQVLNVPRYDFSWQLTYVPQKPIHLPKGTKIECTAYFDNSPNNPANPDATKEVRFGDQSWEEMMIGFFDVAFSPSMKVEQLYPPRKPKPQTTTRTDGE
ncbi:MAG: thiol-disulfide isomerase [Bryobacteraceae bacterium]|nr:thiol-disulfide isomerase [Bryobacteraceae bacterium]